MPAREFPFQAQSVRQRLRIIGFGFGQQLLDLLFNLPQLLASATVTDRRVPARVGQHLRAVNGHRDLAHLQDSAAGGHASLTQDLRQSSKLLR